MTKAPADELAITGLGLYSPIGKNAEQTVTSVRATLNRFRKWKHLGMDFAEDDPEGGLPAASAVPGLGNQPWAAKGRALIGPALEEALFHARLYDAKHLKAAYRREAIRGYLACPYSEEPGVDRKMEAKFFIDAAQHCVVDITARPVAFVPQGHAGGLLAVQAAMRDLAAGESDVCLLAGLDSYLHTFRLLDLLKKRKIKIEDVPSGFIPGEAGAVLVLERTEGARARGATVLARILAVGQGMEPVPYDGEEPLEATGLSTALKSVVTAAAAQSLGIGDIWVDLNGERGRFHEWALAEVRCLAGLPAGWKLHHAADCLGDLGAATGPMLMALAAADFHEGRNRDAAALVCAMSARGERAAVLLARG